MTTAGGGWTRVFAMELSNKSCVVEAAAKNDPSSDGSTCAKLADATINAIAEEKIFFSRIQGRAPLFTKYTGTISAAGKPTRVLQSGSYDAALRAAVPSYTPQYGAWIFFHQQNGYDADRCFGAPADSWRLSLEYFGGGNSCTTCAKYACSGACNVDCPTSLGTGFTAVLIK
ncbi:MAG: hypothetical protein FJ125_05510 [Deltaproteobacteria bacterium]|nr:hypothetical protein [Deltaproteobacteria bacterium]